VLTRVKSTDTTLGLSYTISCIRYCVRVDLATRLASVVASGRAIKRINKRALPNERRTYGCRWRFVAFSSHRRPIRRSFRRKVDSYFGYACVSYFYLDAESTPAQPTPVVVQPDLQPRRRRCRKIDNLLWICSFDCQFFIYVLRSVRIKVTFVSKTHLCTCTPLCKEPRIERIRIILWYYLFWNSESFIALRNFDMTKFTLWYEMYSLIISSSAVQIVLLLIQM